MATPVNKRQYGTDAVGAPLSFNQLDSNFAYFENMISGSAGYIPVILGNATNRPVPGFPSLEYEAGKAQAPSAIKQIGGSGIFVAGLPLLEASASLQVFSSGFFTGSLTTSGGLFTTTVSASAITASGVLLQKLVAPEITGSLTGSIVGYLTGSMAGAFVGSASGYFAGQVDGTASFTTAPIQTILDNGRIATGSFTLVGGTMRIGTATTVTNLVVDGTSSFNGYINTENTKFGNNDTDVHYISGGLTIHAPYVNGTYPAGVNIKTGTNLAAGGRVSIGGIASLSSSLYVGSNTFVTGTLQVTGAVGFNSTLDVKGNTSITGSITNTVNSYVGADSFVTGTLQVTGAVGFASTVDIKNNVTLTGSLTNTGLVALGSTLTVQGATSLSSSFTVAGATQLNSSLGITGIHTSTNATDSTATGNGSIITAGGIGIAKALWVGGLANIAGAVTVGGATQINNTIGTTGVVTSTNSTDSTATGNGSIITAGGIGIAKAAWIGGLANIAGALTVGGATQLNSTVGATGVITSTNTTDSTATGNGSIITAGGIGIAKAAWIGGLANIAGALTVGGATQLNSTLGSTGVVTLTNTTEATSTSTGAIILSGGIGMAKNLWVGGTLNVAGAVTLGTITGTLANALTVDNSSLQLDSGTTYTNAAARTISVKLLGITNGMLAGSIANAKLANSTISGIALGSDLTTLTRGSYLTGGDYNGGTARTWAVDAATAATADKIVARDASGYINAAGFFQTSKRSAKTDIIDFDKDALDIIRRTKIVEFYYLTDLGNKHVGFIADDTDPILSTKTQDQMDTNSTLAVALKAIQQLEARVVELEKQLASK